MTLYGTNPWELPICYLYAVYSITIISMLFTFYAAYEYKQDKKGLLYFMWVFWVIVPPSWFSFEYFYIFKEYGNATDLELFKYGQDIASKVWLSVVTIITTFIAQKTNVFLDKDLNQQNRDDQTKPKR